MERSSYFLTEEEEGLAALRSYGLLDATPEVVLDDLVRLAQHICRTPVAAIRIIDRDKDWFKAYAGPHRNDLAKDATFCRHVAGTKQLLIVPDARLDSRFKDTHSVKSRPKMCFFGGVPLVMPGGRCVGVLCLYDKKSRSLTSDQIVALTAIARQAVGHFEMRQTCHVLSEQRAELGRKAEQLQETMKALAAGERRYSSIVKAAINAIITIDADGIIQGWDGRAEEIFGWKTHEILLQPLEDFLIPSRYQKDRKMAFGRFGKKHLKKLCSRRLEFYALRKGGREFPVEMAVSEIQLGTGEGFIAYISDLTAQKEAEAALRESELRHYSISKNVPGLVCQYVVHPEGYHAFRYVSEGCKDVLGIASKELEDNADKFFEMVHPDDLASLNSSTTESATNLAPWHWGGRIIRPSGEVRWISGASRPRRLGDGSVVWDGVITDVTDQKAIEGELRDAEERFKTFVESAGDAFFLHDVEGRFVEVNRTACEVLGYTREELLSMRVQEIDLKFDAATLQEAWAAMEPGVPTTVNSVHRRKDGSTFPVEVRLQLFQWKGRKYLSVLVRDVTDRIRLEEEERAKREAERANLAKSQFLSRMSHELRTPLNSVLGFAQLLEMQIKDSKQRDCITQISRGGRHLLNLINEVLDIARIESGDLSVSIEPVALDAVIEEAMGLVLPMANRRSIHVLFESKAFEGVHVSADRQRLLQVLINLLSNAIKYNSEGGSVAIQAASSSEGWLRIDIADTGPGIPADMVPRLFTPFERLGVEQQAAVEGTGLGLALSKRLAEAMGGNLELDSSRQKGACFYIELQRSDLPASPSAETEEDQGLGICGSVQGTVLYIEDNAANVVLVERILTARPGVELTVANKGLEGWEMLRSQRPDVLLLDLDLPDIPGTEILDTLKKEPGLAATEVVVVSADATPTRIQTLMAAGASAYVTKPLDVAELLDTIDALLRRKVEKNCA